MKSAIFAVAVAAASTEQETQQKFTEFVKQYNKQYSMEEVVSKYSVFKANLQMIESHDETIGWTMGLNEFADMTWEEFSAMYKGYNHRDTSFYRSKNLHQPKLGEPLADVDWSTKGAVTPIKDQGQCGSCWAFSTTGGMEGAVQISTGKLTSLSEQELVDCAGSSGNQGCNGGLMDDAFQWIIKNGGLGSESSYPYTARDGSCKQVPSVSKISGFKDVQQGSEDSLMSALQGQPVSIAIEADQSGFQFYKSGVFQGPCGKQLDHGVLLVGAGTDNGVDYWKVKNSWGASWGDNGYIRMVRGQDMCGLADAASYPTA